MLAPQPHIYNPYGIDAQGMQLLALNGQLPSAHFQAMMLDEEYDDDQEDYNEGYDEDVDAQDDEASDEDQDYDDSEAADDYD